MSTTLKVLWVDDEAREEKMKTRFEELFESHSITVEPCVDVHSFLELINADLNKYDVIVMDLIMPPRGAFPSNETARGLETGLRLLKALRAVSQTPVVVVTIRDRNGLAGALGQIGVIEHLPKTAEVGEIARAIKNAYERGRATGG